MPACDHKTLCKFRYSNGFNWQNVFVKRCMWCIVSMGYELHCIKKKNHGFITLLLKGSTSTIQITKISKNKLLKKIARNWSLNRMVWIVIIIAVNIKGYFCHKIGSTLCSNSYNLLSRLRPSNILENKWTNYIKCLFV